MMKFELNAESEEFEEITLFGQPALFTNLWIEKSTVPKGLNAYYVKHTDDGGTPCEVNEEVVPNLMGTVLTLKPLDLGEGGCRRVGSGDVNFGTGECESFDSFVVKQKPGGTKPIVKAKQLMDWLEENDVLMNLLKRDCRLLIGYLNGHGYELGQMGEKLYRMDVCMEGDSEWEETSIDEVIDSVCDWNYQLLLQSMDKMEGESSAIKRLKGKVECIRLRNDEKNLDRMFRKTSFGKRLHSIGIGG